MRTLTSHYDGHGLNELIKLLADERDQDAGNASHSYSAAFSSHPEAAPVLEIEFQHGPRDEPMSRSGVTDLVVLCILIDRLEGFQAGPFACSENQLALDNLRMAENWIRQRADNRSARGVLGKNEP